MRENFESRKENFESRPHVDKQNAWPHHDAHSLAELVDFMDLLGQSSLGSTRAREARDIGISARRINGHTRSGGPTDPLVVEAEFLAAERFTRQGDEQTARIICRSVLSEPVTDQIWSVQCKAADRLTDDEHLSWLMRTVKSGYRQAFERLNNIIGNHLDLLLAEYETASSTFSEWLTTAALGNDRGLLENLLRRWIGDSEADEILADDDICASLTRGLAERCSAVNALATNNRIGGEYQESLVLPTVSKISFASSSQEIEIGRNPVHFAQVKHTGDRALEFRICESTLHRCTPLEVSGLDCFPTQEEGHGPRTIALPHLIFLIFPVCGSARDAAERVNTLMQFATNPMENLNDLQQLGWSGVPAWLRDDGQTICSAYGHSAQAAQRVALVESLVKFLLVDDRAPSNENPDLAAGPLRHIVFLSTGSSKLHALGMIQGGDLRPFNVLLGDHGPLLINRGLHLLTDYANADRSTCSSLLVPSQSSTDHQEGEEVVAEKPGPSSSSSKLARSGPPEKTIKKQVRITGSRTQLSIVMRYPSGTGWAAVRVWQPATRSSSAKPRRQLAVEAAQRQDLRPAPPPPDRRWDSAEDDKDDLDLFGGHHGV